LIDITAGEAEWAVCNCWHGVCWSWTHRHVHWKECSSVNMLTRDLQCNIVVCYCAVVIFITILLQGVFLFTRLIQVARM